MEEYKIPKWCKDAVLTDRGVANMFTGELYISKKGVGTILFRHLIRDLTNLKGAGKSGQIPKCCLAENVPIVEEVVEAPVVEEVAKVEEVVEAPVVEEVVKKPVAKKPAAKKAPAKKPAAKKSPAKKDD